MQWPCALAEATAESVGLPMAAEWADCAAAALALEAGEPAAGARQEPTTSAARGCLSLELTVRQACWRTKVGAHAREVCGATQR